MLEGQVPIPMLPPIETDRTFLRLLRREDARDYHALETDAEVKQSLGGPSKMSVQAYEARIAQGAPGLATTLAVTRKSNGQFLGRCGFTEYRESGETVGWEINIVLGLQCPKKQGYATEIGRALISRGFETLGCDTILGVVDSANTASCRLCEKLGMTYNRDTTRHGRTARIYTIEKPAQFVRCGEPPVGSRTIPRSS